MDDAPQAGVGGLPMPENPTPALRFIGSDDAVSKLFVAMATARKKFGAIVKDKKGQKGHQGFKYAPLVNLTAATIEHLSDAGVGVNHFIVTSPTIGMHRMVQVVSGHGARIESYLDFAPQEDSQEYGRQTTYLRRYLYNALFVLDGAPDADEPGGAAAKPEDRDMQPGQQNTIVGMLAKLGIDPKDRDARIKQIAGTVDLKYLDAQKVIQALGAELDARKNAGKAGAK